LTVVVWGGISLCTKDDEEPSRGQARVANSKLQAAGVRLARYRGEQDGDAGEISAGPGFGHARRSRYPPGVLVLADCRGVLRRARVMAARLLRPTAASLLQLLICKPRVTK